MNVAVAFDLRGGQRRLPFLRVYPFATLMRRHARSVVLLTLGCGAIVVWPGAAGGSMRRIDAAGGATTAALGGTRVIPLDSWRRGMSGMIVLSDRASGGFLNGGKGGAGGKGGVAANGTRPLHGRQPNCDLSTNDALVSRNGAKGADSADGRLTIRLQFH